jgi:hypothetical protein
MVHQRHGRMAPSRRPTRPGLIAAGMIVSIGLVAAGMVLINTPTASRQQARPDSIRKIGVSLSTKGAQPGGRGKADEPEGQSKAAQPGGRGIGRVYAPYLANWADENLASIARASGAHYLILAYLTTAHPGSCALTWQGDPARLAVSSSLATQFAQVRALGGDVIPSFGGYLAGKADTDIADSCTSVPAIAAAYESVIARYSVTRIDLDIEAASLTDRAGITRRSAALALAQRWASRAGPGLQIVVTFSGSPQGLNSAQIAVLKSMIAHGVKVSAVNLLAYDYYGPRGAPPVDMAAAAISGLQAAHGQLGELYPKRSAAQLWSVLAVTLMPGIDDNPSKAEITEPADAAKVLEFAREVGLAQVSIWSLDRDNGQCPGTAGSSTCSGIRQAKWTFSRLLEAYPGT